MPTPTVATTATFNLEIDEIIREALERIGGEWTTADEQISARRSLNLLFIDLQNRGFPLAQLQYITGTIDIDDPTVELNSDVADILDIVRSYDGTDIQMEKISYSDWLDLTKKDQSGPPTQVLVERMRTNIKLTFWPVPQTTGYTYKAWAITRIKDVTKGYQLTDFSYRYLPCITSGLAFYMGAKRDGVSEEKIARLKSQYLEDLQFAFEEDRERVNVQLVPSIAPLC